MSQDIEQEHLRAHKALELLPTYLVIITKQIHPTLLMPQANKAHRGAYSWKAILLLLI